MALLNEFLRELGAASFDEKVVQIVSDNAKAPSKRIRRCAMLRQPLPCSSPQDYDSSMHFRYGSDRVSPYSARRSLSRYHSEPIHTSQPVFPDVDVPNGSSRWAPTLPHQRRDELLVAPQRTWDGWNMRRNYSDSALLSVLHKGTHCSAESKNVLRSLQQNCSASNLISEVAHASRLRPVREDRMEDASEHEKEDATESGILEKPVSPPGGSKQSEQEDKERCIQCIVDVSGGARVEADGPKNQDKDKRWPVLKCVISSRNVLGEAHVMMRFIFLVVHTISVELLGPVVFNANQLLLLVFLEGTPNMDQNQVLALPLLGMSSESTKVEVVAQAEQPKQPPVPGRHVPL